MPKALHLQHLRHICCFLRHRRTARDRPTVESCRIDRFSLPDHTGRVRDSLTSEKSAGPIPRASGGATAGGVRRLPVGVWLGRRRAGTSRSHTRLPVSPPSGHRFCSGSDPRVREDPACRAEGSPTGERRRARSGPGGEILRCSRLARLRPGRCRSHGLVSSSATAAATSPTWWTWPVSPRASATCPEWCFATTHMFICSDPGQALIEQKIKEHGLNRVVVAACSPTLHQVTFRRTVERAGLNQYLFEHVNIREHVSWVVEDREAATLKAIRLVRAAVNRARHLVPLDKRRIPIHPAALVIGGGVAGLMAARDLAERGMTRHAGREAPVPRRPHGAAVEPVPDRRRGPAAAGGSDTRGGAAPARHDPHQRARRGLGGRRRRLPDQGADRAARRGRAAHLRRQRDRRLPRGDDQRVRLRPEPPQGDLHALPRLLPADAGDRLAQPARSAASAWRRSAARASTSTASRARSSCTPASSSSPPATTPTSRCYGEYGYGIFPKVITLQQLHRLLDPEGPTGGKLPLDGQKPPRIGFIHCVGARQVEGVNQPQPDGKVKDYCAPHLLHGGAPRGAGDQGALPGRAHHLVLPGHPHLRPRARGVLRAGVRAGRAVRALRPDAPAPRREGPARRLAARRPRRPTC